MTAIKCKMCGGDLHITEGSTIAECEYCGTKQTIPTIDNEKKETLFGRAGRLFRACEFDKAAGIYESLVAEFPEEAEAYWGLVLCKYGIEYVDDSATGRKVPTCHRSSFDSVMDDSNFEQAEENADVVARKLYRDEAKTIEELRKGIIEVSNKEEPYDIFICYKETDENGERTLDSVMAQDVYDLLTEKGYRVFFSRITLEEKLGQEYEPYIFAALNSAKIMLVFGTDYEHFNAVWVKNEWSRFLSLIAAGEKKTLIPCFKGIDAYDMPKEFARLQAQDLGKVGAVQDLLRGIEKLTGRRQQAEPVRENVNVQERADGKKNVLLKRGYIALEDREWVQAEHFFEQALNLDAEYGEAYFGKVLAASECCSMDEFVEKRKAQTEHAGWQKLKVPQNEECIKAAIEQYCSPGYLSDWIIREKFTDFDLSYISSAVGLYPLLEQEKRYYEEDRMLSRAVRYASGEFEKRLKEAQKEILGYIQKCIEDAEAQEAEDVERIKEAYAVHLEDARKEAENLYESAQRLRETDYIRNCEEQEIAKTEKAILVVEQKFRYLSDYKDSRERAERCRRQLEEIRAKVRQEEEAEERRKKERKRKKGILAAVIFSICLAILLGHVWMIKAVIPNRDYKKADALSSEGDYVNALEGFAALGDYKDAKERTYEVRYAWAESLLAEGNQEGAAVMFKLLGGYKDAAERSRALMDGTRLYDRNTIVCGGYHTVGIKSDGTVVAVGDNEYGQCDVSGWTDIVEVAAGTYYTVGLKSDGTVVTAGDNKFGQCNISDWRDIVKITAGYGHTVGLKSDGTVIMTGYSTGDVDVSDWEDIIMVAAGGHDTIGIKSDGTVVTTNSEHDVSDWMDIVDVAVEEDFIAGLKSDGTVCASQYYNDVSSWTGIVDICVNFPSNLMGLKSDGTVFMGFFMKNADDTIGNWTNIVDIMTRNGVYIGLRGDGTVVAAGTDSYNQCTLVSGWTDMMLPWENIK